MKKIARAVLLTLLLSPSILAGEIPTSGITPPPPPPDGMQASTAPGDIPTVGLMGDIPSGGWTYEIADTAVGLIQMLLGYGV